MCKMLIYILFLVIVVTSPAITKVTKPISSSCREFQWQCRDGTCISFDGKCDGAVDCPDGSDETHALCKKTLDQFKCQDGSLIPVTDYCDGFPDCPDGSDETVAACANKTCPSYQFQCANGACVHQRAYCNGIQDCADGSDEQDELCKRIRTLIVKPTPIPTPKPGNCILPSYPNHGTYEVSNLPSARPGQSFENFVLTVSCQRGYGLLKPDGGTDGNDTQTVNCLGGVMYQNMPECVLFCRLDSDPSVRYMCQIPGKNISKTCEHYVSPGTIVNPVCKTPNYYSLENLRSMKCIGGSWDYIAQCKAGLPKNGTNIAIQLKDKVEIYVNDFFKGDNNNNNKVGLEIGSSAANNNNNNLYNLTNNNILNIYINDNGNVDGKDTTIVNSIDFFQENGNNENNNEVSFTVGSSAVDNNNFNKYNLTNTNVLNIYITNNRDDNGKATTVNLTRRLENGSRTD